MNFDVESCECSLPKLLRVQKSISHFVFLGIRTKVSPVLYFHTICISASARRQSHLISYYTQKSLAEYPITAQCLFLFRQFAYIKYVSCATNPEFFYRSEKCENYLLLRKTVPVSSSSIPINIFLWRLNLENKIYDYNSLLYSRSVLSIFI